MPREEISKARLNRLRGLDNHERIDEELYHDYESEEAKKVNRQRSLSLTVIFDGWIGCYCKGALSQKLNT